MTLNDLEMLKYYERTLKSLDFYFFPNLENLEKINFEKKINILLVYSKMDGSVMKNIGNRLGNHKARQKLVALFTIKTSTYLQWEAVRWTHTLQGKNISC